MPSKTVNLDITECALISLAIKYFMEHSPDLTTKGREQAHILRDKLLVAFDEMKKELINE